MDISRYEVNQKVRGILNRYDIDLTKVDYSCIGNTVYLSGELFKTNESDIVPAMIDSLFKEIARLSGVRNVQCDLQNWSVSCVGSSWQIMKSKKKTFDIYVRETQQGDETKDIEIDTSEDIADVLKDMQEKPEQEDQ